MIHRLARVLLGSALILTGTLAGCGGDEAHPFGGGATGGAGAGGGSAGATGTGGDDGTGGVTGGAGERGTGGVIGTGGRSGSGGVTGSGGVGSGGRGGSVGTAGRGGAVGSGGAPATGGRPGTGGGVGGTGGLTGSGGRPGTGGSGGLPGTGGSGGRIGGTGGTNQPSCDAIAYAYQAEMPKAKMCTDQPPQLPCMHQVSASLGCGSNCITSVQDPTRLNEILIQWKNAGCDQIPRTCPAIACSGVQSGKCVVSGTANGMCVDNYGGPSI